MSAALDLTRPPSHSRRQQAAAPAYDRCQAPSGCRWFVVASKPNAERRAHAALHLKGYQPYLPLITVRWRDRTWHTAPLFPGYLFIRLDLTHPWYPIRSAPGVFQLLTVNGIPAPCPDHAVEAVQSALQAREALVATEPAWKPGAPCSLLYGPLRGMPAIVTKVRTSTANITIMMLGQLRRVTVDLDCLRARDE